MILRNSWPKRPAPIPPPLARCLAGPISTRILFSVTDSKLDRSSDQRRLGWCNPSLSRNGSQLAGCCRELEGCLSRNRLCIEFFCELENWSERISKSRLSNFDRFDWILLSLGDGMIDATIERKKEKIIRASGLREESVRELNKFIVDDGMEVYYHSSSRCS